MPISSRDSPAGRIAFRSIERPARWGRLDPMQQQFGQAYVDGWNAAAIAGLSSHQADLAGCRASALACAATLRQVSPACS